MPNFNCGSCKANFQTRRACTQHLNCNEWCRENMINLLSNDNCRENDDFCSEPDVAYGYTNNYNLSTDSNINDGDDGGNINNNDESDVSVNCEIQLAFFQQAASHGKSGRSTIMQDEGVYKAKVELLKMLKFPGCPLFLFEKVLKWAGKAQLQNNVDFALLESTSREQKMNSLLDRFDFNGLEPNVQNITLPGSGEIIPLVTHDFMQSLYSLLSDSDLMKEENFY